MRRASERTAVRRAGQGTGAGAVACASRAIVGSMMRRTCVLTRWVGAGLLGSALGLLPFDDQSPIAGVPVAFGLGFVAIGGALLRPGSRRALTGGSPMP